MRLNEMCVLQTLLFGSAIRLWKYNVDIYLRGTPVQQLVCDKRYVSMCNELEKHVCRFVLSGQA